MFVRVWKKGNKNYVSVVRSRRVGDKVIQETIQYIGAVDSKAIPYLKAAFSKDKPKLVYKDGTTYEP